MKRYFVCRHYIKWKGQLYKKGELLPENFTEHDRVRNIYSSRIASKEVPDEQPRTSPSNKAPSTEEGVEATTSSEKGTTSAKPKFVFKPAGTK